MRQSKYPSEVIVPFVTVAGNIRDLKQGYSVKYYPKSDDLVEKLALCVHLKKPNTPEEKQPMPRYLFFSSVEQLKILITDLIQSYLYFLDKKTTPVVPREQFRLILLNSLLTELKEKQLNFWREEDWLRMEDIIKGSKE